MTAIFFSVLLAVSAPRVDVTAPICNDNAATPGNTIRVVRASDGYPPTGLTPQTIVHIYDLQKRQNVGWLFVDDFGQQYLEPRAGYANTWIPRGARPLRVKFRDAEHMLYLPQRAWRPSAPYVLSMCTNTE